MSRINIYNVDEYGDKTLEGWFDPTTATRYNQDTEWNGHNMVGVITRSEFVDEYLYRTKGGRWVLNHDASRYCNGPDTYAFLTDEQARDWLLRSERNDDVIEQYFGEVEEERGPGRPEVGDAYNLRFPAALMAQIDARAQAEGVKRAEMVRRLCEVGLSVMPVA